MKTTFQKKNIQKSIVSGNFHLSVEDEKKFENDVREALKNGLDVGYRENKVRLTESVLKSLKDAGFKIVKI